MKTLKEYISSRDDIQNRDDFLNQLPGEDNRNKMSTGRLRYDLKQSTRGIGDDQFAVQFPNLNREITRLSEPARNELAELLRSIMINNRSSNMRNRNRFRI
jgi:hypothetical protein